MSAPVRWTVVSHAADDSVAATSVVRLMEWLHESPAVELHTILWAAGFRGSRQYDFGRLADVGRAHEVLPARLLRAIGQPRIAGGVAGRAVRSTLRRIPTDGVLYLSSARAGAVLRYLPPGSRTVITHLHAADRAGDEPLPPDRVDALTAATDVWLAVDDETRTWAVDDWGLDPDRVHVVPEPVDPASSPRSVRVTDPNLLRLGLRGSTWFRRDHAPRLVQTLLHKRPGLNLELVWTGPLGREHLGPLLHDIRQLGLGESFELPSDEAQVREHVTDLDALAFTTPDDDPGWILGHAGGAGVPMVCFDTHRSSTGVTAGGGRAVAYLDIGAMADAVLYFLDRRAIPDDSVAAARTELSSRTIAVLGPRVVALAEGGRT